MREVPRDNKWEEERESQDPFADGNREIMDSITLLRIYDALMALLTAYDARAGRELYNTHAKGGLMGPAPKFNPEEMSDDE